MRLLIRENPEFPETAPSDHPWWDHLVDLAREIGPANGLVEVNFLSDREIREVNRDYRGQDKPTDVLSFTYGESSDGQADPEDDPLGEILLSVETARSQARAEGHSVAEELSVLVIHGLHHILGMDHQTEPGAAAMLEAELPWRCRLTAYFSSRTERG
ncbi:MAG: rRNA maturation RNase YbeY [bacterium]|nr:rRNA maturation RNase YbeY [bacterium]